MLPRRRVLAAALLMSAAAGCSRHPPVLTDPAEPLPPVEERLRTVERLHDASIGVYAVDLDTGRHYASLADERFALCSTFKTYAAARVLQMAAGGELHLQDEVFVDPTAVVDYSPVTAPLAGVQITLETACRAALQHSDNTAGNLLLARIGGPPAVTAFARSIGDQQTRLDRWETDLNTAAPGDPRDTSTPRALGEGYRALLAGDALDEAARGTLVTWMRGNVTSVHSMRAGLPADWTTADKTGAGGYGSTNDVGVVFRPGGGRLLLSVMCRSRTDDPAAESSQRMIAQVTAAMLPWYSSGT